MKRVGFLACSGTLAGSPDRRADAYEHDLQIAALRHGCAKQELEVIEIDWRAPVAAFAGIELVLLGTVWDYQDHEAAFLARLHELAETGVIVCNPAELVRWNIDKAYLRELATAGVATIPTLWPEAPEAHDIEAAFAHFDCETLVVKRRVGAGAEGQLMFGRDDMPPADWRFGHRAMIQPFVRTIVDEGEYSFVFVDGEFSHAILKTAASGEYRIQSLYGGKEQSIVPDRADLDSAKAVVDALPGECPLYARIDMIRLPSSELALMEAELIEPYLYPAQGPELGERLALAVRKRLG